MEAENLKPSEINSWLEERFKTPATKNRYKAFLSLCYREGIESEKVSVNPAKLVRRKKEPTGRARFLSREHEYPLLCKIISKRFPEHLERVHRIGIHGDETERAVRMHLETGSFRPKDDRAEGHEKR